jgi:hypothetical protein
MSSVEHSASQSVSAQMAPTYTARAGATADAPERPHFQSETLPGLGNGQILPDWVHVLLHKLFKRDSLKG